MLTLGVLGDRMARIARADAVADSVALAAAADGPAVAGSTAGDPAVADIPAFHTVAQQNQFEIVQLNWQPQATGQCWVQVEVREAPARLQARSNFWNSLVFNTPVASQAVAVSSQPCG